jgi:hypothetical protein
MPKSGRKVGVMKKAFVIIDGKEYYLTEKSEAPANKRVITPLEAMGNRFLASYGKGIVTFVSIIFSLILMSWFYLESARNAAQAEIARVQIEAYGISDGN